jgi:hypothetical protein
MRLWEGILLLFLLFFLIYIIIEVFYISSVAGLGNPISTTLASIGTTDRADLVMHPEKYVDQNVTIVDNPTAAPYYFEIMGLHAPPLQGIADYQISYSYKDEEGKPHDFSLRVAYPKFYCAKCKITGVVQKVDFCNCQSVDFINFGEQNIVSSVPGYYGPKSPYNIIKNLTKNMTLTEINSVVWKLIDTNSSGGLFQADVDKSIPLNLNYEGKSIKDCEIGPQDTTYTISSLGSLQDFKFYRCAANTTHDFYYLNVTHVTSLD